MLGCDVRALEGAGTGHRMKGASMNTIRMMVTGAAILGACASARADFFADFDSYASGARLQGVDGWKGWDNVPAVAGMVSNSVAYDGANSLKVSAGGGGYTDAVHQFSGVSSNTWSVSAMQYLGAGQGGSTYFILMNKYSDGGNNNGQFWSTQLRFDLGAGRVYDDIRGGSVAIVTNQWAAIRVDINFATNTVKSYYNNALISSGAWTRGGASALSLAAIDLYTGDANTAYYDDVAVSDLSALSVTRVPAPGAVVTAGLAGALVLPIRRRRA